MKFNRPKSFNEMREVISNNNFQTWIPLYKIRDNFLIPREMTRGPTINQPTIPCIRRRATRMCINKDIFRLISSITFIPGISWLIFRMVVFLMITQRISSSYSFISSITIIPSIISSSSMIKPLIVSSSVVSWIIFLLGVILRILTFIVTIVALNVWYFYFIPFIQIFRTRITGI